MPKFYLEVFTFFYESYWLLTGIINNEQPHLL